MRPISHDKNNRSAGFTLIETMVIVAVIGIIAGLTIPNLVGYFQRQKLQGARSELLSDIAYARSLAIARRTTFRLVVNGNDYQIIQPGPDTVIRQNQAPDGVTFTTDVNPQFYPHGLADAANITVDGASTSFFVTVLPNGTTEYH